MDNQEKLAGNAPRVSRKTLRLTFRTSDRGVEFVSVERLDMITPPQPGETPQAGKHGGYWFELRDGGGRVLAHSIIDSSLLNSVEVHSPDGKIQREFGAGKSGVFEVLLPDLGDARTAVLVGTPLRPSRSAKAAASSADIASFDLSSVR